MGRPGGQVSPESSPKGITKPRGEKMTEDTGGLLAGPLGIFVMAAVAVIVLGTLFGVFNQIQSSMEVNGTSLIPQEFSDLLPTTTSFASLGILILTFVGVISMVIWLARAAGA